MRRVLFSSIAAIGMAAAPAAFAQTTTASPPQSQTPPQQAPAPSQAPVYGSVQSLRMVDGVPGATYGYGAQVSQSGDTVTYTNVVPPN